LKKYLQILQNVFPIIRETDLDIPIKDIGIDSLDLVVVRVEIEKYFGKETTDVEWYQFKTLSEAFKYFENNIPEISKNTVAPKQITSKREYEIRMPQMAANALSENWLLKEMGDLHWDLLSQGLEQKSSEFKDENGNRLYATFVRIRFSISPLKFFQENELLTLKSEIKRFGNNGYFTTVIGNCNKNTLEANLMTSFTQRHQNDNSKILKGDLKEKLNVIEQIKYIPEFFNQYRLLKKNLLEELQFNKINFSLSNEIISSNDYSINPYYDINGVGLLYFASYPIISDKCTADYLRKINKVNDFESSYSTIYRDIFYFANCNTGDHVNFNLHTIEDFENDKLIITTSLYRASDKNLMAKIFTIKQKTV
jgi:probable biosynthetic protein (TIGR04098 family)